MSPPLGEFHTHHAARIAGWVDSVEQARAWCGHAGPSLPDASLFESWHRARDVHPHVLTESGELIAYGEIWVDRDECEIELARLIVRPDLRGRGVGRRLVGELLHRALSFGLPHAFVRVQPSNAAAIACYEQRFNREQPVEYVWLRRDLPDRP